MKDELFDVVNENNILVGQSMPRSVVHSKGFWHRTVHVYVFRKAGSSVEFLTHLRSKNKDLNPDKWDTRFGGHVQSGDDIQKTIVRELEEEAGIKIAPPMLIIGDLLKRDNFPNREFTQISFFEYDGSAETLKFNDGEVQEVKWRSIDEIMKSMQENLEMWSSSPGGFKEISDYLLKKVK